MALRGRSKARDDGDTVDISFPEPAMSSARVDDYEAWAERLQRKRVAAKEKYRGPTDREAPPTYWDAEHVFDDSERLSADDAATGHGRDLAAAYAVLGLDPTASAREVETAFRGLAKLHHPDRHVTADDQTRAEHLDEMRRVNDAYATLRRANAG